MGCGPLVLGIHIEWDSGQLCSTLVYCSYSLATGDHEFRICLRDALRLARSVQLRYAMPSLADLVSLEYYRQTPPKVPHFLKTLFRRKLVLWFLASEILRDYWLSGVSRDEYRP
jgi:hypothetical protein